MKVKDILTPSFTTLQQQQHHHPTERLWRNCLSVLNQFCEAVVRAGFLSWEQMVNAACRYCIGASKLGGTPDQKRRKIDLVDFLFEHESLEST